MFEDYAFVELPSSFPKKAASARIVHRQDACYHFAVISDTTPEAAACQLEIVRTMSGEQRIQLAYEMSIFVREIAAEGIRHDHPDWTGAQIARELLRRAFFPAPLPPWLR
jgi:hypothetical protein